MLPYVGRFSKVWLVAAIICALITAYFTYDYVSTKNYYLDQAQKNAILETQEAAQELSKFIMMLPPIAKEISQKMSNRKLTKAEIETLLRNLKPVEVAGVGFAFKPYAFDPNVKLFSRNLVEQSGKINYFDIGDLYDYTTHNWFKDGLKPDPHFTRPYYGPSSKTILAEYSAPIYNQENKIIGMVFANQSVEHLQHILDSLFLGRNGYWFILTDKGNFLAHPQSKYIHKGLSISDLAKEINNPELATIAKDVMAGKKVFFEYNNEITHAPSWMVSNPIQGTPWSIVGVFDKNELDISRQILRHKFINPMVALLFCIIFLTLFFLCKSQGLVYEWHIASGLMSAMLAATIIWVWYANIMYPYIPRPEGSNRVVSKEQLYEYLDKEAPVYRYGRKEESKKKQKKKTSVFANDHFYNPNYIHTGIYINDIEFSDSNEINLNMYIWQRYLPVTQDNIPRGFILPQASKSTISEIRKVTDQSHENIMWEAYTSLYQFLTYTRYPFDTKIIRIKLWPKLFKANLVLVPDLDGYQVINPRSLPGINNEANLPGWKIQESRFSYQKINYVTNFGSYSVGPFGLYEEADISDVPQLYFNIVAVRRIVDALISDLLPIAIIAVLLYIIILASIIEQHNFIGWIASVFFATIFAQIRFRTKIPQAQIVYFSSFYFAVYAMILAVLAISVIQRFKYNISFFQYENNLMSKVLYWPILFSILLMSTLWYLY